MDDQALLDAVAEGNQDAMAVVFDRYARIVRDRTAETEGHTAVSISVKRRRAR